MPINSPKCGLIRFRSSNINRRAAVKKTGPFQSHRLKAGPSISISNIADRPTAAGLFERETIISHRHALPMIRNLHNSLRDFISAILLPRNENPPTNTARLPREDYHFRNQCRIRELCNYRSHVVSHGVSIFNIIIKTALEGEKERIQGLNIFKK